MKGLKDRAVDVLFISPERLMSSSFRRMAREVSQSVNFFTF